MNVLALNGSPRMENSSTYHMLQPLLDGMQSAGATTEVIHIHKLHLRPCLGCYVCWYDTPGVCIYKDSFAEAIQKYVQADFVIFGTPLYMFQMTGEMKNFIDRLALPLVEPTLASRPDDPLITYHPNRYGDKNRKVLLISPCGFPEFQNFDALVHTFKFMASRNNWTYLGEILRPEGEPLAQAELQPFFEEYYARLRQAGTQLICEGAISETLQQELRMDLFPGGKEKFYQLAADFQEYKSSNGRSKHVEPMDKEIIKMNTNTTSQQPTNALYERMAKLPAKFSPAAAGDFQGDIQFDFSGAEAGQYYLHIENGGCRFIDGLSSAPKLTLHVSSEDWQAMGRGELSGPEAFMSGRLKADGDFGLMMRWQNFFATV